ncbi:MAG: helix-turn-helix domain-containing protein [Defluviitaleaceae bacterium]|nr:helix-turn-helix domain-containing protein [Defluviitaleaceae bacterium]
MAEGIIYGLGDKLKKLREKHKFTQKEVAKRMKVTPNTISRYENDEFAPKIENLIQFAIIYNTSLDYLMGIGKESYLYLYEFDDNQRAFILQVIKGIKDNFDYNNSKKGD